MGLNKKTLALMALEISALKQKVTVATCGPLTAALKPFERKCCLLNAVLFGWLERTCFRSDFVEREDIEWEIWRQKISAAGCLVRYECLIIVVSGSVWLCAS